MATANNKPADEAGTTEAQEPRVELNSFCARLSETMTAPELFGAFAHVERVAGRVTDTASAYRARFDLFRNQPV